MVNYRPADNGYSCKVYLEYQQGAPSMHNLRTALLSLSVFFVVANAQPVSAADAVNQKDTMATPSSPEFQRLKPSLLPIN